jgi:ATP-dependent DNA helicase RecG
VNLDTPLRELALPPQRLRQVERAGLCTVGDLLTHYPRRYEDRTHFEHFPTHESDEARCVCGVVKKTRLKRLRGRMRLFEVHLEEAETHALSPQLVCKWFNQPWVEKAISVGHELIVYGRPKRWGSQISFDSPEFEVADPGSDASIHMRRIVPVHRATEGLPARALRELIYSTLALLTPAASPSLIPPALEDMPRAEALRQIHFPDSWEALEKARRHLVLTEFFGMQLAIAAQHEAQRAEPGEKHAGSGELMRRLHARLPFPLTRAQDRVIMEIRHDMLSTHRMNRLLHGDVGSGKTLVALSAMLLAVEAGFQAALMAPTQILAEQHYLNFRRLLEPLGISVALRTGARKEDSLLPLFDTSGEGAPQIFVGTHALLYEDEATPLARLGLVVIDEQHKFGVLQRARLRDRAAGAPDVLVMTATPIPRTLTMTVYGDLDISVLDELPRNRGKIVTAAREPSKLPEAAKFLRQHLEAGRQAYIVYPLIDESEKLEAKAAATEFQKWRELLAPLPCDLLHGRIPTEEKEAIMERFRRGETKALIATTVIEVGIDVPNANLMLIENAERFGLAQLHQLRGRIGRGEHKSYCVLLSSADDPEALEKLRILESTSNGFEIAEADLQTRGPGDLLGTAQSGLSGLKLGDMRKDADLMQKARGTAYVLIERDPRLELPENRIYRTHLAAAGRPELAKVS